MIYVEKAIANVKREIVGMDDDNSKTEDLQLKLRRLEQQLQSYNRFRKF